MKKLLARSEFLPGVLLLLAFLAGIIESPYFLDIRYLLDATSLYAEGGLLVLGMTFVIITGNIDLSVASNMALTACAVSKLLAAGMPIWLAVFTGLLFGMGLGAFNGLLVAYARLPSFLVTLGTMALFRGAAQAIMGSESVRLPHALIGFDGVHVPMLGLPLPFALLLLLAVVFGIVLHRSVFGRWVFAVGTNEDASACSGVPVATVKFWVFMLTGLMAGIAALLIDSRLGVARFDHGRGLELDVITATVLGGTSIYGGKGSIFGSVLALLLIAVVRIGMGLANITAEVQLTVVGTLLVVAVGATAFAGRVTDRIRAGQALRLLE